jgi:NitT/TauT family transport system permease protein
MISRAARIRWIRLAVVVAAALALELLCRFGIINRLTMIPPTEMALALYRLLLAGKVNNDIAFTLRNIAAAIAIAVLGGFLIGAVIHAMPRVRRVFDPLFSAYYAVPTFVLYPLMIVIFGIGAMSLIVMGAAFGIVAMIVNTLIGLDRVPRALLKTGRVMHLGPVRAMLLVRLPAAAPHLLTGFKLAVTYSVIGVVAGEFILATAGLGKRISFAYNDFDNATMYGLLLFILTVSVILNSLLHGWEQRLHRRWGRP